MPAADPPAQLLLTLRQADDVVACLRRGEVLRCGRKAGNDLVLDDTKVSREHFRIEWPAGAERPVLVDLGSANGVLLDGERVGERTELGGHGRIEAGDSLLKFSLSNVAAERLARAYNLPDDSGEFTLETRDDLQGRFDERDELHELLQGLERSKRSGTLHLEASVECLLTFAAGRVMSATWGPLSDLAALERAIELERGAFRFSSVLKPAEASLDLSISDFLQRGF